MVCVFSYAKIFIESFFEVPSKTLPNAVLLGPRQLGRTIAAKLIGELMNNSYYFNWHNPSDRSTIMDGSLAIAQQTVANQITDSLPLCILTNYTSFSIGEIF